jgi:hypothetical protein
VDVESAGDCGGEQPPDDVVERYVTGWLSLPEFGAAVGVDAARVRQLHTDRQFLARRRGERNVLCVPAEFAQNGALLKSLPGTLSVLADAGYSDEEALRWLFTPDPTLPGSPVDALRENRGTEIRRRAQALAF